MPGSDFLGALEALTQGGVEFVVVDGVAAVLNGAPINTFDLDIVPSRSQDNIVKLLEVLNSIHAVYRFQPERQLKPDASHLSSAGHQNLTSVCGPLDVLGSIGRGLTYDDLLPHSAQMQIGGGLAVRVLNLDKLIELKEDLAGEKDAAVLPVLRRVLKEKA